MKKNLLIVAAAVLVAGTAGAASLTVNAGAALEGSYGLQIIMDGVADGAYVVDTTPDNEVVYRAQFLIDLNPEEGANAFSFQYGFPQPTQDLRGRAHHMIFSMKDLDQPGGASRQHASVHLKKFDDGTAYGRYKIWARTYDPTNPDAAGDGYVYRDHLGEAMEVNLPKVAGGFPVIVLFEWKQSTGANDGMFSLTRATNFNPTLFEGKAHTQLRNADKDIDQVELGAPSGVDTGSAGSYDLDSFESYRTLAP